MQKSILTALAAALLFGISTPLAKLLLGHMTPVLLAGLLYLGSGIGLGLCLLLRRTFTGAASHTAAQSATQTSTQTASESSLQPSDLPWLAGAIVFGGIGGPILLMLGLAQSTASGAALLLNLEGVLTALLAWFVVRENFDRRTLSGMLLITAGGVLLVLEPGGSMTFTGGSLLIIAACACWAIDNNLTRKISASDALQIATIKGLVAALVNLALAWQLGAAWPPTSMAVMAGLIGFAGYGLSLVLFVVALRELGSARTGAYFSAAPMVGAALSLVLLQEAPDMLFWCAALLMGAGLILHWHEHHHHEHHHDPLTHAHPHTHDPSQIDGLHHQHKHAGQEAVNAALGHTHRHTHTELPHSHPHFPDIHHRHEH